MLPILAAKVIEDPSVCGDNIVGMAAGKERKSGDFVCPQQC
jgi:hypothetical protein